MSFLDQLNPEQRRAAQILSGPVLILAGAGSGKTRTLTHRLAHLIASGTPAHRILAVTFTNKAAREMKERTARLIGESRAASLWIGTFHSICARILRRDAHLLGYDARFTIYYSDDSLTLVKRIMREHGTLDDSLKPGIVRARISEAKAFLLTPEEYARNRKGPAAAVIADLYRRYQAALMSNNAMDFDDLLALPVRLFRTQPEVLAEYRTRFQHLLIDEYQDTNQAQYVLVKMLAENHHNICAVGDDDQSIYGWRGADITNILNFEKDFPDATVVRLEQNYRSTRTILKAAGAVVRHNRKRKEKELWTQNGPGDHLTIAELADEKDEAEWIRERLARLLEDGHSYGDIAVLYRTNAQSRAIEEAFVRSSKPIPYTVVGGLRFYERKEIKDVLAYLRVIDNPRDSESLRRIVNVPRRGIGDKTMALAAERMAGTGLPLMEALRTLEEHELGPRAYKPVNEFIRWLDALIAKKTEMAVDELLEKILTDTGYRAQLEQDGSIEAETRLQNIGELVAGATAYVEANNEPNVSAFLEDIALVTDADEVQTDGGNSVTLMTLHSAKGLEFPVVFVSGMEEGLFPIAGSLQDAAELEEERRLFYVGLTRAQKLVFLSYAQRRRRFNEWANTQPSRFLQEIPNELLKWDTTRAEVPGRQTLDQRRFREDGFVSARGASTRHVHTVGDEFSQESSYADDFSQTVDSFLTIGHHVMHPMFGRGKITNREGFGVDTKLTILFDSGQTKKILVRVAHLEPCV